MAGTGQGDTKMKVGFLGMGIMGTAMASNLVKAGFPVTVWNRNKSKCDGPVALGASVADTPASVVQSCQYTFVMLSDPQACNEVTFGDDGILSAVLPGKCIVDMSTVDPDTSSKISKAVVEKGGRFLEAPVSGSKKPAEDGQLVILAAGDQSLFNEVVPHFDVMGKKSVFLGDVGMGAKMKLVANMVLGNMTTALCEALGFSEKSGLKKEDVLEVLGAGAISSPWYNIKGNAVLNEAFKPEDVTFPLKHMQKDLRLALELGDTIGQKLSVANETNELFKQALDSGRGDCDIISVYRTINDE